jgi:hypothetical protein
MEGLFIRDAYSSCHRILGQEPIPERRVAHVPPGSRLVEHLFSTNISTSDFVSVNLFFVDQRSLWLVDLPYPLSPVFSFEQFFNQGVFDELPLPIP